MAHSGSDATRPIAVFDSGVGGLTVLHECLVSLPHEDFLYFGDTARFPYGERSADELRAFAVEIGRLLLARGAKLLVVACNSATSAALEHLRAALGPSVAVLGVVEPESRLAAAATRTGEVGLLATSATVASGAYERALAAAAPDARLHAVACPELAPLIQAGGEVDERVVQCVAGYCAPLRAAGVDTVILGCTHYPLVGALIRRELGRAVRVISSGQAMAEHVERGLRESGLERDEAGRGRSRFLCSGDPEAFARVGVRFLQMPLGDVRRVAVAPAQTVSRRAA